MSEIFKGVNLGDNVDEIVGNNGCTVLKIENETGEGIMTIYNVMPGVILAYNDFHMAYCESKFQAINSNLLCIDHCKEGSMEQSFENDIFYYVEAGDLNVDVRRYHAGKSVLPLKHYHGISIGFYLPEAEDELKKQFRDFSVNLKSLQEKFCNDLRPKVIKASDEIAHIFSELYRVPAKIQKDYFRIKIFELLIFLDALEFDGKNNEKMYFHKTQVEKVKSIHSKITTDLTKHFTIEELAADYDISQTALKKCFKTIYGLPINSYLQIYRINVASTLLIKEKEKGIAEIAGRVGYDSPSKFAAVFKKIMGVPPYDYRKKRGNCK